MDTLTLTIVTRDGNKQEYTRPLAAALSITNTYRAVGYTVTTPKPGHRTITAPAA